MCDRWWFAYIFKHLWFNKGNTTCLSGVLGEWKHHRHVIRILFCWQTECLFMLVSTNNQHKMVICLEITKVYANGLAILGSLVFFTLRNSPFGNWSLDWAFKVLFGFRGKSQNTLITVDICHYSGFYGKTVTFMA